MHKDIEDQKELLSNYVTMSDVEITSLNYRDR